MEALPLADQSEFSGPRGLGTQYEFYLLSGQPDRQDFAIRYEEYLTRMAAIAQQGGSLLVMGDFGTRALSVAKSYPLEIFSELDKQWEAFALSYSELDLYVPPVLSIVLTRAARREALPAIVSDLRAEWATARRRLWALLDQQKRCRTLSEAVEIKKEIEEASKLFSPFQSECDSQPLRVLWQIFTAGLAGAGVGSIMGNKPLTGAVTGSIAQAGRDLPKLVADFGSALFGRGAFDLARRVRRSLAHSEVGALKRLLSESEKKLLNLT